MTLKQKALIVTIAAGFLLGGCGLLPQGAMQPTAVSMDTINTLVAQTLEAQQAMLPPTFEPVPTTAIPPTPTITPTVTPSIPLLVANIDTNCREGADPYWEVVAAFKKGSEAEVLGMWMNGAWYLIWNPKGKSYGKCWVWGGSDLTRKGDWSRVPIAVPQATPTPM